MNNDNVSRETYCIEQLEKQLEYQHKRNLELARDTIRGHYSSCGDCTSDARACMSVRELDQLVRALLEVIAAMSQSLDLTDPFWRWLDLNPDQPSPCQACYPLTVVPA